MQFTNKSLLGNHWRIRSVEEDAAQELARAANIDTVLARFLLARGVHPNDVSVFLSPSLKAQLPDPSGLQGIDSAVARIVEAIEKKQNIVIFGDYDVDGATASAVMVRFLRMVGADAKIYIPDRILEGYGPNVEAFLKLRAQGADLVITVDCGTVSFEPILEAKKVGLEIIVVDHHLAVEALPEAISIINPNRRDDTFPEKGLCAAGVCFLLCVAINRALTPPPLPKGEGHYLAPDKLIEFARELRKNSTDVEKIIWSILRNRQLEGYKFRRQHPVSEYVADFCSVESKLIIELDGGHHAEQKDKDDIRTNELAKFGYKVIRFWNNEVLENIEGVVDVILNALTPLSPRERGRGEGLLSLLDLVALGTVCDVMPLIGLNRAYVAQGLKVMAQKKNLGIRTLMEIARVEDAPTAYHLGFIIGPRINAGGRIGKSDLGARLLTTEDEEEALTIAKELDRLNAERRTIETLVLEEALQQIDAQQNMPMVIASGAGWHAGVIGIVAGRLKEKAKKPVAVIGFENGIGKASARSITGVDLGTAITQAREEGLLVAGGGHAMAAGFTIEEPKLPALTAFLCERLEAPVAHATANAVLWLDAAIGLGGINTTLVHQLSQAAPYGNGHSEPIFVLPNVTISKAKEVGQGHISCFIAESGFKAQEAWHKAVAFRAFGTPLETLLTTKQPVHLAGKLKINLWNNRESVEFHIEDAMLA